MRDQDRAESRKLRERMVWMNEVEGLRRIVNSSHINKREDTDCEPKSRLRLRSLTSRKRIPFETY